jgi:hypothetical protein
MTGVEIQCNEHDTTRDKTAAVNVKLEYRSTAELGGQYWLSRYF